jgi:hypothetical protein
MPPTDTTIRLYLDLAAGYERSGDTAMRDRFLVLACDALLAASRPHEAERVRGKLLAVNPHHMLKPFASMAQAMHSGDVRNYVEGLRRHYPPETARPLLETLRGAVATPAKPISPPIAAVTQGADDEPAYRLQDSSLAAARPPASSNKAAPERLSEPYAVLPPAPPPWRETLPDESRPAGAWVATTLFWLGLAGGLALALYTLARPFLPR